MKILLGLLLVIICCTAVSGYSSILIGTPTQIPNFNLSAEVGQPDFQSSNAGSPADNTLYICTGVFSTTSGLYVADSSDSGGGRGRILFYPQNTIKTTNTAASIVFGTGAINPTGDDSNRAYVAADSTGNVYSSVLIENTVLRFAAPITAGQAQTGNLSPGAIAFSSPAQIAVDPVTQNVYVADTGNNRVLVYPANPTSQTQPIAVYGKSSVNSTSVAGVDSLSSPLAVAVDCYGGVWISALLQGSYSIAYYPVNVTDRALYYLLPPSLAARRADFGFLSSLSWDRSTCNRLLLTTQAGSYTTSPSVIYILSITFNGATPSLPPSSANYILSGARNAIANPTSNTDSLITLLSSVWDVNIPGYFWTGDTITHRVTLQSFNGSSINITAINAGATSPSSAASPSSSALAATPTSTALAASPSTSISASVNPSASVSVSTSVSFIPAASVTPTTSVSLSLSVRPSNSINPSVNASVSTSASFIPAASATPSANTSVSISASFIPAASATPTTSVSLSLSVRPSNSLNPSANASTTFSSAATLSVIVSGSTSPSASVNATSSVNPSTTVSAIAGTPSTTSSRIVSTSTTASTNATAAVSFSPSTINQPPSASRNATATPSTAVSVIAATLSGSNTQSLTVTASAVSVTSFASATASPNNITGAASESSSISLTSFPSLTPSFSFGSTPSTSESGLPPVPDASQSQSRAPSTGAGAAKSSWASFLLSW